MELKKAVDHQVFGRINNDSLWYRRQAGRLAAIREKKAGLLGGGGQSRDNRFETCKLEKVLIKGRRWFGLMECL
jgi:hypothetical protein